MKQNTVTAPQAEPAKAKPEYVTALEAAYGAPSQAGFGSAVFHEQLEASASLEQAALAQYQYFVGDLWERYGKDAWMGPWKEVYAREAMAGLLVAARRDTGEATFLVFLMD